MTQKAIRIAVTGGGGNIAYSLLFRIASGEMFGQRQPVKLHILEVPEAVNLLKGVEMELNDCAYPLLEEVVTGSNPEEVFGDIYLAILVGAKPRSKGMERKDLLRENARIFMEQGRALDRSARRDVKVLVVGNPCNTNCWITMKCAPGLDPRNFHALTRLDQNRQTYQLARKAGVSVKEVQRTLIWGNHSATQVPDILNPRINQKPVKEVIRDHRWLEEDLFRKLQQRGAEIIEARGKSSAASAAGAVLDAVRALEHPSDEGEWYSDCVISDGNPYGIKDDLIFSFPCVGFGNGKWDFAYGLQVDSFLKEKLALTEKELLEEKEVVSKMMKERT